MKKNIKVAFIAVFFLLIMSGCTEAFRVNANINQAADNFNVTRRLEVINARTDQPLFELIGNFHFPTTLKTSLSSRSNWKAAYIKSTTSI